MKTTQTAQVEQVLAYLLTGNPKHLKTTFPRKRGIVKQMKVSSPPVEKPKPKKHRQSSHNAYMDIEKAHQRFIDEGYIRSHSHRIGHVAKVNGFRLMSNYQKEPGGLPQQPPYHRKFETDDWQHANVGPQVRN